MTEEAKKKTAKKKVTKKVEATKPEPKAEPAPASKAPPVVNLTRERLRAERGNEAAEAMVKD